ncbi:MAG: ribose 5-phosphate isomerase A [Planctomycetota bacterium]
MTDSREIGKRAAARAAADDLVGGLRLGLGTGSTVRFLLERLAERMRSEGVAWTAVATSEATAELAMRLGLAVVELDSVDRLDVAIDGADEVDPRLDLIKGGGGALTREKIVAAAANRFVVIVDDSKLVDRLGATFRLPIEVLRFGWRHTRSLIENLGLPSALRVNASGTVTVTDNGNYLLDAELGPNSDLGSLERALDSIPGVVECGLFVGMAHEIIVGSAIGRIHRLLRD